MLLGYISYTQQVEEKENLFYSKVLSKIKFDEATVEEQFIGNVRVNFICNNKLQCKLDSTQVYQFDGGIIILDGIVFQDGNSQFKDRLSAQQVLELFTKHHLQFLDHINGEFTIIIIDSKHQKYWFIGDHFGTIPLSIYQNKSGIYFCNDSLGLASVVCSEQGISDEYIKRLFTSYAETYSTSPHKSVRKVLPGHYIECSKSSVTQNNYWKPEELKVELSTTFDESSNKLKDLLNNAIDKRLDSCLNNGAHISGGLDSTLLAVLCREKCEDQHDFYAFSWSPIKTKAGLKPNQDERTLILEQCDRSNMLPVFTDFNEHDYFDSIKNWKYPLDFPYEHIVQKNAQKLGVQVIFSGWGADEFAGLAPGALYYYMIRTGRFSSFFSLAPEKGIGNKLKHLLRHFIQPTRRRPYFRQKTSDKLLKYLSNWGSNENKQDAYKSPRKFMLAMLDLHHLAERCESWYLLGQKNGIQYRYPFLDKQLVEFCFKLDPMNFIHKNLNKPLIRSIAKEHLIDKLCKDEQLLDPVLVDTERQIQKGALQLMIPEINQIRKNNYLSLFNFSELDKTLAAYKKGDTEIAKELSYILSYLILADCTIRGLNESTENGRSN